MLRNDDIVEDFVPTEQYSMHSIPNEHNISHELRVNNQLIDNFSEQQNCETIASNVSQTHINSKGVHKIGFYGWRKKCLYFFILLVTIAVVINAALTLWIIAVLSFSWDGIGKLKIQSSGVHLKGEAFLFNNVYASHIRSTKDHYLRIHSDDRVVLNTNNPNNLNNISNRLFVANNRVNGIANQFVVRSPDGKLQFLVSESNVVVATDKLRVINAAGIRFNGSIQVPTLQSCSLDKELSLLSPTRRIRVRGPHKISLKSSAKDSTLFASSVKNLHFRSKEKMIHLNSSQILLQNLRTAYPTKRGRTYPSIYQLCICAESGRLFMVPPEANCRSDTTVC